jgi:putative transposase
MNRGARKMRLFDEPGDYRTFLDLMVDAQQHVPMRCLAYCVMPNHFHLVLWPREDGHLSRFMFLLTGGHAMQWQHFRQTRGLGHVYQGRFKALPVSEDGHFLRVCRYVEQNPLRAGLVSRAEDWPWSSLSQRNRSRPGVSLEPWPVSQPRHWLDLVNRDRKDDFVDIREAIKRNAPFGSETWKTAMTERLGLRRTVAPIGRPPRAATGLPRPD